MRRAKPLYMVDRLLKEVTNVLWKHVCFTKAFNAEAALKLCRALERLAKTRAIGLGAS